MRSPGADLKRLIPLYTGAREPRTNGIAGSSRCAGAGRGGFMKDRIVAKPIIAAVNGVAYAGGCELVLACDIRIATATARFACRTAQRENRAGVGSIVVVCHDQFRYCLAMELMMTGRIFTAPEALAAGMINRSVSNRMLLSETEKMVEALSGGAPLSVQAIKRVALQAVDCRVHVGGVRDRMGRAGREVTRIRRMPRGTACVAEKRPATVSRPIAGWAG